MSLQQNIAAVRAAIDEAARRAGRDPKEVTLVAATKVQTSDTIRQAIAAGIMRGRRSTLSATCKRTR